MHMRFVRQGKELLAKAAVVIAESPATSPPLRSTIPLKQIQSVPASMRTVRSATHSVPGMAAAAVVRQAAAGLLRRYCCA